jgi:hypothetical protein
MDLFKLLRTAIFTYWITYFDNIFFEVVTPQKYELNVSNIIFI